MDEAHIVFKEESYQIVGACFEVYKEMGCGFLEAAYQECLGMEFVRQAIPHRSQLELVLSYKGMTLKQVYVPDFLCFEKIIVEIKAVTSLEDAHRAQVHNYLKVTGKRLGLLVNFDHYPKLDHERVMR